MGIDKRKLRKLQAMLEETECSRMLSDDQLTAILAQADGDLRKAAYLGAIKKSHASGITLPDGTTLPSDHEYWLRLAAMYRPNRGGTVPRADGR